MAHHPDRARVAAFQMLLTDGDSPEAKALADALAHQKNGRGTWGPKTQAAFESVCHAAGIDPKTVDFENPKDPELLKLTEHLSKPRHGTGLILEDLGKPEPSAHKSEKPPLSDLSPAQSRELQQNMVKAGLLSSDQADGHWDETKLNAVRGMIEKHNEKVLHGPINSNNDYVPVDYFMSHPNEVHKGPLYFVNYTATFFDQVNGIAQAGEPRPHESHTRDPRLGGLGDGVLMTPTPKNDDPWLQPIRGTSKNEQYRDDCWDDSRIMRKYENTPPDFAKLLKENGFTNQSGELSVSHADEHATSSSVQNKLPVSRENGLC